RLDLSPIDAVFGIVKGFDDSQEALLALVIFSREDLKAVFSRRLVAHNVDHGGLSLDPRDHDDAMMVPWEQRGLSPDPKVLVLVADRLTAAAEAVEKLLELLRSHTLAVISDHPSINALRINALPLDSKLDLSRAGLHCIDGGLTDPLEFSA